MRDVKFSICIPNYNYAQYVGDSIQSVLDQSYQNFELIIADNCSTDDSLNVIKSFKDPRIKLIENKYNIGFSPNLDKATSQATGDFMLLLSSDDLIKPDALTEYNKIINELDNNEDEKLILTSSYDVIDSDGKKIIEKPAMSGDVIRYLKKKNVDVGKLMSMEMNSFSGHEILRGLLLGQFHTPGHFCTTCYSSELYQQVEGYNSVMSVWPDANFSHKILFENPKIVYVNRSLFCYRVHAQNNYTATQNFDNLKPLIDAYLLVNTYDKNKLNRIKLNKVDLEQSFVNNTTIYQALHSSLRGQIFKCLRILFFSLSAFPKTTLKNKRFYLTLLIIPFFFLFNLLFRLKRAL